MTNYSSIKKSKNANSVLSTTDVTLLATYKKEINKKMLLRKLINVPYLLYLNVDAICFS
jgi:hypothetical protein